MAELTDLERALASDLDDYEQETRGWLSALYAAQKKTEGLRAASRSLPEWWSTERDAVLRMLARDDGFLSSVMARAVQKASSLPFKIAAKDDTIALHQRQAELLTERIRLVSQNGNGWKGFIEVFARDYLGQDNGAFGLAIYDEDNPKWDEPPSGQLLGFRALDAAYCTRTNNPMRPVAYQTDSKDKTTKQHIHRSRLVYGAANPSSERHMNGVGYCPASLSMMFIEDLWTTYEYRSQKMGSSPAERIILAKGFQSREVVKMMATSRHLMVAAGLHSGAATTIIGGDVDTGLEEIRMNNFDQFDTEQSVLTNMGLLGLAWGMDPSELYPVEGTRISEDTQVQRSRGAFIGAFIEFLRGQFEFILPSHLYLDLDYRDDMYDKERAIIQDINARNTARIVEVFDGLPEEVISRMMLRNGLIENADHADIMLAFGKLPDGRSIGSSYYDPVLREYLPIPRDLLQIEAGRMQEAMQAINLNRVVLYEKEGTVSGASVRRNIQIAHSALDWLEGRYLAVAQEFSNEVAAIPAPPQPPETGKSIKGVPPDLEEIMADFEKEIAPVVNSKPIDQNKTAEVLAYFVGLAYLAGSRLRELDELGKAQVDLEVDMMTAVIVKWDAREDMTETIRRMKAHLRRGYWVGLVEHKETGSLSWTLGATEKHCATCLEMAGLGARDVSFWKDQAAAGIYPGSPLLECTGIHCDCEYAGG